MLKKWIKDYIEVNKKEILYVISFLILGFIIGVFLYIFSSQDIKIVAIQSVKKIFDISKGESYIKTNIIINGLKQDIFLIAVLSIFSMTLFGKWFIYLIISLKGIGISIYIILLFNIFGPLWGILVVFLLVILVNLIFIPALIYISVCFLEVNFNIFKTKINDTNISLFYKTVFRVIIILVIMFSSVVVEQIASSIVLDIYYKI